MKELRVTDKDLLLLMDAVNLLESAFVYTHYTHDDFWRTKDLKDRIRVVYNDF
jgi:hypothetical protein